MVAEIGQIVSSSISLIMALTGGVIGFLKQKEYSNGLMDYIEACERMATEKINVELSVAVEYFRDEINRILEYPRKRLTISSHKNAKPKCAKEIR